MDDGAYKKHLDFIQSKLDEECLVDSQFRVCYSLKDDINLSFFVELVPTFLRDARTSIREMAHALETWNVNFYALNEQCIKLTGSSGSIGACKIKMACDNLSEAVDRRSKDECVRALRTINQEYRNLQSRLENILKLEKEAVSGESSQAVIHRR